MIATVPPAVIAQGAPSHAATTPGIKFQSKGSSGNGSASPAAGSVPSKQSVRDVVMLSDDERLSERIDSSNCATPSFAPEAMKERNKANMTRASRASAVAALASQVESDLNNPEKPRQNPARKAGPPLAPRLDFSTLRTDAPPSLPSKTPENRMFGLEHAPIYFPTIDEFASPLEYIEKISVEAKEFGICKVVPPEGWRPPFALNTETFRFKTRLQLLNSMEASARASINFLEQLHIFHRQHGNRGITIPQIAGKPLDLWRLRKEINLVGGYAVASKDRLWSAVVQTMGYDTKNDLAVVGQIKAAFLKIIVPFEEYVKRIKVNGGILPPDPAILHDSPPTSAKAQPNTPKDSNGANSLATPSSELPGSIGRETTKTVEQVRTASDELNRVLGTGVASGSTTTASKQSPTSVPGETCEICSHDHDPNLIVLCDGCDRGYHTTCLDPPLPFVPTAQFYCDTCLVMNGADYGFEEGEVHSLYSFRRRADAFKSNWLAAHPMPKDKGKGREDPLADQAAIENFFEKEFWRCVESQHESVEVEYGADVNYSRDGGGLPTIETHPSNPYSRDGWNLHNLPILAGSLLRYIKSDISGMTIPWIYVGMVFSTFAWHKEDHYTYSINYHHFGDTKTWYGIPGADDEKLEAAMKLAAPELFEQQPDLMFQLVTLMSPGRLQKHGVRVVACDQRPNEFVITFPRAYHSGFNHGFNFNEAVNFALPDWLPTGLNCVNRYRDIKKNPVFSHDELLVTVSLHEKSPRNSRWLVPSFKEMVDRELDGREKLRLLIPDIEEFLEERDIEEEEFQCESCKALAYLSQVTTIGHPQISCLEHSSTLPEGPKKLRLRFADVEMKAMYARVKSRSDKAGKVPPLLLSSGGGPLIDSRTTGRKRKPSKLAISNGPVAQRARLESPEDEDSVKTIQATASDFTYRPVYRNNAPF